LDIPFDRGWLDRALLHSDAQMIDAGSRGRAPSASLIRAANARIVPGRSAFIPQGHK
jgi:hypothetical protein